MVDEHPSSAGDEIALQPVTVGGAPRRRALWALLAVAALAVGALAVTSGSDGPPRLPVGFGASGGREAAGTARAADMALWNVVYRAGDGLPTLGGKAVAYRLSAGVGAAEVRALAEALGMSGTPTHDEVGWHLRSGTAALEVAPDGSATWWYNADATVAGISSSGGSAGCDPDATECAADTGPVTTVPATAVTAVAEPACSSDGSTCTTVIGVCGPNEKCIEPGEPCGPAVECIAPPPTQPEPPADLPTKDEARAAALELLRTAGMDVDGAKVTVDGPYDAWYVSVEPLVDGVPVSGLAASVAVGSKGRITSASGYLGTPTKVGEYPLLDTRAAIDRLNSLREGGFDGGPVPLGAPAARDAAIATADAPAPTTTVVTQPACKAQPDGTEICESVPAPPVDVCVEEAPRAGATTTVPATTVVTDASGAAATSGCVVDPVPQPTPDPVTITLTDATEVLTVLYATDGSTDVYLVPGYRFSNVDGVQAEVAAVDDDSLAPTTTAPATTDSSAVPPPSDGCEVAVEGDSSGTTHTIQTCPPAPTDPVRLEPGQTPELGVGYYVDVNTHCGWLTFADRWWATDEQTPLPWASPTEGGTFTLRTPDEGTFVGDAQGTKTATFTARGPADELPGCA